MYFCLCTYFLFSQIYKIKIIKLLYVSFYIYSCIYAYTRTYVCIIIVKLKRKLLNTLSMLNQENHNLIHPQTADFVYYQVPLVLLLSALSDLPFAVALQILVERYTEVAAVTLNAI